MAAPRIVQQIFLNWQDALGGTAQTGWTTLSQASTPLGPYASLVSAAAALSNAAQQGVTFQAFSNTTGSTGTGSYATVRDQAVFLLSSGDYSRLLAIPAPKDGIFLADGITVDMSNAMVVAFIEQVKAVLGNSYGGAWTTVKGGRRRRVVIGGS